MKDISVTNTEKLINEIVAESISEIIVSRNDIMNISLKQKAKFEGWLKFELASSLKQKGMEMVKVEAKKHMTRSRCDISFFYQDNCYTVELKTSNTSWKIDGIDHVNKPISKNISSIIKDTEKLNSKQGIMAFVLFPIPPNDTRWEHYIDRICVRTGLSICKMKNCKIVEVDIGKDKLVGMLVCTYMSKVYNTWFS